jgi:hypothetical protein
MAAQVILSLSDAADVAEARRMAVNEALGEGFGAQDAGRVAIVATELAGSLVRHAGGGMLAVGRFDDADGRGIELLAIDSGLSPRDGSGSPTRQAGIRELADRVQVDARPGGTIVLARLRPHSLTAPGRDYLIGALSVPRAGDAIGGDDWMVRPRPGGITVLLADGAGHGAGAAAASGRAVVLLREHGAGPAESILRTMHHGLAASRGAAVAVADIDLVARRLSFAGLGGIAGLVFDGAQELLLVSQPGIAGHGTPDIAGFSCPLASPPMMVLHTAGFGTGWSLAATPGLASAHPGIVAGILYRDFRHARDDATVLVLRSLSTQL